MATLTVVTPDLDGATVTYASAAGGGDEFPAGKGGVYHLHLRNGDASPITATLDDPSTAGPEHAKQYNPDVEITVGATSEVIVRVPGDRFTKANGRVGVSYSGVTTLTVAVIKA